MTPQPKLYAPVGPWAQHAACRGCTNEMEMPEFSRGRPGDRARVRIANARAICAGCPVRVACLTWALQSPDPAEYMVAGGMTPGERAGMRDRRTRVQTGLVG